MITIMMVADTVSVTTAKGLSLLRACQSTSNLSLTDSAADQISAMIQPYDAVAAPPVKPATYRLRRRTLLRKKQRTKRRLSGDQSGEAGNDGFLFSDGGGGPFGGGGGGDGPFGGGGGGFGGGGRNFNRFGDGYNWDESSSSVPDPAFDFVYQVLSWIMLSNCLHFAIKKIVRILAAGSIVDSGTTNMFVFMLAKRWFLPTCVSERDRKMSSGNSLRVDQFKVVGNFFWVSSLFS